MEKAECGCVIRASLEEVLASDGRLECELHKKKLIKDDRTFTPNIIYFT